MRDPVLSISDQIKAETRRLGRAIKRADRKAAVAHLAQVRELDRKLAYTDATTREGAAAKLRFAASRLSLTDSPIAANARNKLIRIACAVVRGRHRPADVISLREISTEAAFWAPYDEYLPTPEELIAALRTARDFVCRPTLVASGPGRAAA